MAKGMKPFPMTVDAGLGGARYCVSWEDDGDFRYHVWLSTDRMPMTSCYSPHDHADGTIYKNEKERCRDQLPRAIRLRLSAHPRIETAIALLPNRAFEEADMRAIAAEHKRQEEAL
jgi:hypothetical protein